MLSDSPPAQAQPGLGRDILKLEAIARRRPLPHHSSRWVSPLPIHHPPRVKPPADTMPEFNALLSDFMALYKSRSAPAARTQFLQSKVHDAISVLHEAAGDLDPHLGAIMASDWTVEQKTMLREMIVRFFSRQTAVLGGTSERLIMDVFALPVFGDTAHVPQLIQSRFWPNVPDLMMHSGYVDPHSQAVNVFPVAIDPASMSQPSLLNHICALWGNLLANRDTITDQEAHLIERDVLARMEPFRAQPGVGGWVMPAVRIWRGTAREFRGAPEILSKWDARPTSSRLANNVWWDASVRRILQSAQIPAGTLMIRPPAPVLVARAQAQAWHVAHQVYDRLGLCPFHEINFVTSGETTLALRAYDKRQRLLAQSDHIPLLDVTAAPDDFSALLQEECGENGPATARRHKMN